LVLIVVSCERSFAKHDTNYKLVLQSSITNIDILLRWESRSLCNILQHKRIRWRGYVQGDAQSPHQNIIIYVESVEDKRPVGRPQFGFINVVNRDLDSLHWQAIAEERHLSSRHTWLPRPASVRDAMPEINASLHDSTYNNMCHSKQQPTSNTQSIIFKHTTACSGHSFHLNTNKSFTMLMITINLCRSSNTMIICNT